jgi:gluconate 5-dehydrogenase
MSSLRLFDLSGKVSIVTGGGRGLGFALAEGLAEAGSNIVLCSRKEANCKQAASKLQARGVRAEGVRCDVVNPDDVNRLRDFVLKELGKIDILVNNSGATWGAPTEEYPVEGWKKVIEVNVTGTFLCSKIVGKAMIEGGGGKIINVSSVYGTLGCASEVMDAIAYNTSKGAINAFTRDLAVKRATPDSCECHSAGLYRNRADTRHDAKRRESHPLPRSSGAFWSLGRFERSRYFSCIGCI